ncbi:hypothetical protein HYU09_05185, partial [Candidatus Woesearchaeota archaeon]|nr:hypothetical protein [Candidatus Woesearchaeota archaeon]
MNQKSEIQISLDDFKIQDIFVFLRTEYKKKLLTNAIKRAGSQSKFATLVKKNINYPKIKQSSVSFLLKKD